jgi:recombination protein RecA
MNDFDRALNRLKKFEGEVRTGSTISKIDVIPSGIHDFDKNVLGLGGFPRGRVIELGGKPSSGKTSLAEHIIAAVQKSGGTAVYYNLEGTYDPIWGAKAGIDNDKLIQPETRWGEEVFDQITNLLGVVDVIVLDSLARLRSKDIVTRTMDDGKKVAANAGMNEMGFGHIVSGTYEKNGKIKTPKISNTKTFILVINQVRDNIGVVYGSPTKTPGGWACQHDFTIRLDLSNPRYEKDGDYHKQRIKIKCIKNKLAPPLRECEFYLTEQNELQQDEISIILNEAIDKGIVEQRGVWLYSKYFEDAKLHGKNKFEEWFIENKDEFLEILKEDNKKTTKKPKDDVISLIEDKK